MNIPVKGEVWEHTSSGHRYIIIGAAWNTITDCMDVVYSPMYVCEFERFTRQLRHHPKAFMTKNDDGTPRFRRIK